MKKRALVLCGLLSVSMAAQAALPAAASSAVSGVLAASASDVGTQQESAGNGQEDASPGQAGGASQTGGDEAGQMPVGGDKEPPELPEGQAGGFPLSAGGEAPEMPDGETPEGFSGGAPGDGSELPQMPDGEAPEGFAGGAPGDGSEPPELPDGEAPGGAPGGMGGPGGPGGSQDAADITYLSVNEFSEDAALEGEEISSQGTDENAVLVNGSDAQVTLNQVSVSRVSGDSTGGDQSSFYGVGAALLGVAGTLLVKDSQIETDAAGGAGIFAYGDGTVYAADTEISTAQNTSGGIHVAGGGILYAWDLDVTTQGESSAAIRSDRGSGTMVVDGGNYTSNGVGSPAVYCTADISVNNAQLTANGSEAVCIEGLNTLRLYDCDLTGNMSDLDQNDCTWNVIVYQSMSGDSEVGNGTFQMSGGSLTAQNGGLFYTTNTECTITLDNVDIIPAQENDFFLRCTGNNNARGWGQAGNNGSDCTFTATNQEMTGDVIWDKISTLNFYMAEGSSLSGAILEDETYSGGSGEGTCSLYLDETSTWTVTGDSALTSLYGSGAVVDEDGAAVTIQGTNGTVYRQGDSDITVTVENYGDTADMTAMGAVSPWENYAVEKPEELA